MADLGFRSIDADQHYYEALDACTRHLDPVYKDRGIQAVTQGKRRKLRRLGLLWLSQNRVTAFPTMRFDVIGVLWPAGQSPRIEHREQAF